MQIIEDYILYGEEWEKEVIKLPKTELVAMLREANTGTGHKKICGIQTARNAENIVEGIINDFESGVSTKEETLKLLCEYTGRLMNLFWGNALVQIKDNPSLLGDPYTQLSDRLKRAEEIITDIYNDPDYPDNIPIGIANEINQFLNEKA